MENILRNLININKRLIAFCMLKLENSKIFKPKNLTGNLTLVFSIKMFECKQKKDQSFTEN